MIEDSGITKKEQEQNPQAIIDVVGFYKENTERGSDEVWDKFENAKVPELRIGTSAPGPLSPGLLNTPGYGSMTSPPASPRFPANHETSFENPRSPPPVPRATQQGIGLTLQTKDANGLDLQSRTRALPESLQHLPWRARTLELACQDKVKTCQPLHTFHHKQTQPQCYRRSIGQE